MFEGGCLCGALRFCASSAPVATGYCHCTLCRRSTGAPVLAWASFPVAAFRYAKGRPAIYASSSWGHREFCSACGTQIAFRKADGAETVDVNVGCADDPSPLRPTCHIFVEDRITWFDTADALPRHPRAEPKSG